MVGGSSGSAIAWDLRWQEGPIVFVGIGQSSSLVSKYLSKNKVWEVKYDHYTQYPSTNVTSNKIPPITMCPEDDIFNVLGSYQVFEEMSVHQVCFQIMIKMFSGRFNAKTGAQVATFVYRETNRGLASVIIIEYMQGFHSLSGFTPEWRSSSKRCLRHPNWFLLNM